MTIQEKKDKCQKFFEDLSVILTDYEVLQSCNKDFSQYLIPEGTRELVTYQGKPLYSFRISDHWNWYANVNKCPDENNIQCHSIDIPRPKARLAVGKASKPVFGIQVSFYDDDFKYHVIYGEKFNRKNRKWEWVETTPEKTVDALRKKLGNSNQDVVVHV